MSILIKKDQYGRTIIDMPGADELVKTLADDLVIQEIVEGQYEFTIGGSKTYFLKCSGVEIAKVHNWIQHLPRLARVMRLDKEEAADKLRRDEEASRRRCEEAFENEKK